MPEIMIEQNQNIINYINMLNLPYSEALRNHMVVSGIISTGGNKNVYRIYSKHTCNRDRSCGSRFLGKYKWNNEYVDYKRISHSLDVIRNSVDEDTVGFLIIDDSLSKKINLPKRLRASISTIHTVTEKLCGHTV